MTSFRLTDHVFTGVLESDQDSDKIVGQIHQSQGMPSAQVNYLLQTEKSDPQNLVILLEGLIKQAGHWGAKQVAADLAIDSDWFPQFRQAGFSVIAKQRVLRCESPAKGQTNLHRGWQVWSSEDIAAVRSLYHTLVPPLVQTVEPISRCEMLGMVHYDEKGELQAYADLVYGPAGAWVLPLIHPQTKESIPSILAHLLHELPGLNGRPVFMTVRSYQPWVEHALEEMGFDPGPEQVYLVRYLALRQRVKAQFSFKPIENGNPEPTFPIGSMNNYDITAHSAR